MGEATHLSNYCGLDVWMPVPEQHHAKPAGQVDIASTRRIRDSRAASFRDTNIVQRDNAIGDERAAAFIEAAPSRTLRDRIDRRHVR